MRNDKCKRIISAIIALCALFCFSACGKGGSNSSSSSDSTDSSFTASFSFEKSVYLVVEGDSLVYGFINDGVEDFSESEVSVTSSDTAVATVEGGKIIGVSRGSATLSASFKGYEATATVNVTKKQSEDKAPDPDDVDWGKDIWDKDEYVKATAEQLAEFSEEAFFIQGRAYTENGALVFDNVNSGLEYFVYGEKSSVVLSVPSSYSANDLYICVFVDDDEGTLIRLNKYGDEVEYEVASGLEKGVHKICVYKATEQKLWTAGERKLVVKKVMSTDDDFVLSGVRNKKDMKIDFYGDSITCGLNNLGDDSNFPTSKENGTKTYAAIAGRTLNAEVSMVSYSGITTDCVFNTGNVTMASLWDKYSVLNGNVYELDPKTDFAVINLGTNDASALTAGKTTQSELISSVKKLLSVMRDRYGDNTKIVWCYGMMGIDGRVETAFKTAVEELGGANKGFYYLALSKKSVTGVHPLVSDHEAAAAKLCEFLKSL